MTSPYKIIVQMMPSVVTKIVETIEFQFMLPVHDYVVLGSNKNLLAVSEGGVVTMMSVEYGNVPVSTQNFELDLDRTETVSCLGLGGDENFVIVALESESLATRLVVYEVVGGLSQAMLIQSSEFRFSSSEYQTRPLAIKSLNTDFVNGARQLVVAVENKSPGGIFLFKMSMENVLLELNYKKSVIEGKVLSVKTFNTDELLWVLEDQRLVAFSKAMLAETSEDLMESGGDYQPVPNFRRDFSFLRGDDRPTPFTTVPYLYQGYGKNESREDDRPAPFTTVPYPSQDYGKNESRVDDGYNGGDGGYNGGDEWSKGKEWD